MHGTMTMKRMLHFLVITLLYITGASLLEDNTVQQLDSEQQTFKNKVYKLVQKWAPLVLLAPGERFLPSSVPYFLQHVVPVEPNKSTNESTDTELPTGKFTEKYHLVTKEPVEDLLKNISSFLYGQNPTKVKVPVYAVISRCATTHAMDSLQTNRVENIPNVHLFHVTYWFFYPFNEGKNICTLSLGFLGPVPIPNMFNKCIGQQHSVGSHVGDWEHMSLFFRYNDTPDRMYVSTHDAGVYYKYNQRLNVFTYERQETRNGILQNPRFPPNVRLTNGHPLLYSAKGSHGLWSRAGTHRFVTVPRFYDHTGHGTSWHTWNNIQIIDPLIMSHIPKWFKFRGRWGNAKSSCHPLRSVGINICHLTDGPTGIPMKRLNFVCPKTV